MKTSWILGLCAAAALTACGGGGDDDNNDAPPVTEQVPAGASQSVGGFIDYLRQLVVASADMLEPVDVSAVTPPADDASEPAVVD
jgi:hypothetical protein